MGGGRGEGGGGETKSPLSRNVKNINPFQTGGGGGEEKESTHAYVACIQLRNYLTSTQQTS